MSQPNLSEQCHVPNCTAGCSCKAANDGIALLHFTTHSIYLSENLASHVKVRGQGTRIVSGLDSNPVHEVTRLQN